MSEPTSPWLRSLACGIRWAPLAWLIGVSEPFVAVAALVSSITLVRSSTRRFPLAALSMVGFVVIASISLVMAQARGEPSDRIVAALFNLAVWVLGFAVWLTVRKHDRPADRFLLLRSVRDAGLWAAAAAVVTMVLWGLGQRGLSFAAPIAFLIPDGVLQTVPAILSSAVNPVVFRLDWIVGDAVPRLQAFHPYPNALALALGLAIAAHVTIATNRQRSSRIAQFWRFAIGALLVVALVLTWSRAIIIVFAVTGMLALVLRWSPGQARTAVVAVIVWCGVVLAATVVLNPTLATEAVVEVGEARAGSTATRLNLYAMTWQRTLERPWFGNGVKPRIEGLPIPIGSHSTLFGTALKSGLLGLSIVLVWAIVLGVRSAWALASGGRTHQAVAVGVLMILAWSLIEDLDAPVVAAVQAFTFMGLLSHRDEAA